MRCTAPLRMRKALVLHSKAFSEQRKKRGQEVRREKKINMAEGDILRPPVFQPSTSRRPARPSQAPSVRPSSKKWKKCCSPAEDGRPKT